MPNARGGKIRKVVFFRKGTEKTNCVNNNLRVFLFNENSFTKPRRGSFEFTLREEIQIWSSLKIIIKCVDLINVLKYYCSTKIGLTIKINTNKHKIQLRTKIYMYFLLISEC